MQAQVQTKSLLKTSLQGEKELPLHDQQQQFNQQRQSQEKQRGQYKTLEHVQNGHTLLCQMETNHASQDNLEEEDDYASSVQDMCGSSQPKQDVVESDPSGRFERLDCLLGRGAFKTVYKGFDTLTGKEVAWNQVFISDVFLREGDRIRLYNEVNLLSKLKYAHVLSLFHTWYNHKTNCINFITEYLTSGTLRQFRQRHKKIDMKVIVGWAYQILQGLVYLHGRSPPIVHRDLKCDNIFYNGNTGQIKIGDLGLATYQTTTRGKFSILGTPEFMAPELYNQDYDEKVDIYSYGMSLIELATLKYPYSDCNNPMQIFKRVMESQLPKELELVKDDQLRDFIRICISHDRDERPSAKELLKHPIFSTYCHFKSAIYLDKRQSSLQDDFFRKVQDPDNHIISIQHNNSMNFSSKGISPPSSSSSLKEVLGLQNQQNVNSQVNQHMGPMTIKLQMEDTQCQSQSLDKTSSLQQSSGGGQNYNGHLPEISLQQNLVAVKQSSTGIKLSFLVSNSAEQTVDIDSPKPDPLGQQYEAEQSQHQPQQSFSHFNSYLNMDNIIINGNLGTNGISQQNTFNMNGMHYNESFQQPGTISRSLQNESLFDNINDSQTDLKGSQLMQFPIMGDSKEQIIKYNKFSFKVCCKKSDEVLQVTIKYVNPLSGKNNTVSFSLDPMHDTPETIQNELVSELGFSDDEAQQVANNIKQELDMINGIIPDEGVVSFETLPISRTATQVDVNLDRSMIHKFSRKPFDAKQLNIVKEDEREQSHYSSQNTFESHHYRPSNNSGSHHYRASEDYQKSFQDDDFKDGGFHSSQNFHDDNEVFSLEPN